MKKNDFFSGMTGVVHTVLSWFMMLLCCAVVSSCGGDDDGGSGGGTTGSILDRLVGSEWKGSYFQVSENGEYEEGTMTLKFTSSDRAEQHTAYSGMEWNSNGEYVEYSGESDTFYEYVISDGKITLTDTGGYGSFTLTPSGNNMLVYGSTVYRLVKEGTGDDTGGSQGSGDVGGNPETGIADFVTTPVRTFEMEFAQGSRDFKVEYVYSGNKVTRMLRSGSSSASYALSYSYDEVTAKSSAYTYTFGLGSTGYANFFRDGADGAWSCRTSGDNDGYMRYFSIENPYDYRYYMVSYSGGNVSRVEEYRNDGELYCTYTFSYTSRDNKNGLYPEASVINTNLEFLRYLGFLGQPSRKLVDKIDFKPADSSYGTMEFSYQFDSAGNVTSYQYTSDPIYKTTDRRQPSPVFRFTY